MLLGSELTCPVMALRSIKGTFLSSCPLASVYKGQPTLDHWDGLFNAGMWYCFPNIFQGNRPFCGVEYPMRSCTKFSTTTCTHFPLK